jgi:hypothetical protein
VSQHPLYPDQLSPDDASLGFALVEVDAPDAPAGATMPSVTAIVRVLGPSERVIKVNDAPGGRAYYVRQVYGAHRQEGGDALPAWVTCGQYPDAAFAVSPAGRMVGEQYGATHQVTQLPPP